MLPIIKKIVTFRKFVLDALRSYMTFKKQAVQQNKPLLERNFN